MQERMTETSELKQDELQLIIDILDRCLQAITHKQAIIESCVRQYPEFKELNTLLSAAQAVQSIRPESLSQMSKSEVRQRILEHYRARKPRPAIQHTIRQSSWFRPIAASCNVILIFVLGRFGLVKA